MSEAIDFTKLGLGRDASPKAYYELGRALHTSKIRSDQDAAIRALDIAHELQPRAAAYTELGIVLKARGRYAEAIDALKKAIKFTPREPAAYLHLGALLPPREAVPLIRSAIALQPSSGAAFFSLASALRHIGDLASAQLMTEAAAAFSPSDARLSADFRHWRANHERALRNSADGADATAGIGYESSLQFPWRGTELRRFAAAQLQAAQSRLSELPTPLRVYWPRSTLSGAGGASAAPSSSLRVAYLGSLSDEPQMNAMSSLFRLADPSILRFAVHPVTSPPTTANGHAPQYLTSFLEALPQGALRAGPSFTHRGGSDGRGLALAVASESPHILLDGLWRKECKPESSRSGGVDGGDAKQQLACALLHKASPILFSVLAAPLTSGGHHIHYTLGDPTCLPPKLSKSFTERFVLLQRGAYPFSHSHYWPLSSPSAAATATATAAAAKPPTATREAEGLPTHGFVLASFVQRWKLNPIAWSPWTNILRRGHPSSVLWLLQHPLDGPKRGLSRMLEDEQRSVGLSSRRMRVMGRQPLSAHIQRTGLADLTLDTWPYTAHTTAADALWAGGAPWLALSASDDRMDSLLSSAVLASAGALPLVTTTLRAFEDAAVSFF